jgi:four helix bundle protein
MQNMANKTSTAVVESMIQLSAAVVSWCQHTSVPKPVIKQVMWSVTNIGANFIEAQDASSKKGFLNKIYIIIKEAAETNYWLFIIEKLTGKSPELDELSEQTQKFIMMLQKFVSTYKESNRKLVFAHSSEMDNR